MNMEYHELAELPAYTGPQGNNASYRWSGADAPPAIGTLINVKLRGIGRSRVLGYFAEGGWLGVLVQPLNPADWVVAQNGSKPCHAFGIEIGPDEVKDPTKVSAEELEALRAFRAAYGRRWKHQLSQVYWPAALTFRGSDNPTHGALLQGLRNRLGPRWLADFRLPK
jgi:hypothetical protein